MLFLSGQIHVYSVLYGLHMLIVDYNFFLVDVFLISYLYISNGLSYIFLVTCDTFYAVYSIRIIWSVWFFG